MIEYIKNIIPRIQRYSKDLSKVENFIDKNWIFIDENGNYHEYLFLRDKRLIMTLGTTTKEGSWELLPTGQLLITRDQGDLVKLENIFVEQALLVLKRSATTDIPFVLINQQLIPDLDAVKYLENYEYEKSIINIHPSKQTYRLLYTGEIIAPEPFVGKVVKTIDGINLFGVYKIANNKTGKYLLIKNNVIKRIFYRVKYTHNNQSIYIEQEYYGIPKKGDIISEDSRNHTRTNQLIEVIDVNKIPIRIFIDNEYKIMKIVDDNTDIWIALFILLVVLIALYNTFS